MTIIFVGIIYCHFLCLFIILLSIQFKDFLEETLIHDNWWET